MKAYYNIDYTPARIPVKWNETDFTIFTHGKPKQDDLHRCNCMETGIGHLNCGICIHYLPVFMCDICFPLSCNNQLASISYVEFITQLKSKQPRFSQTLK